VKRRWIRRVAIVLVVLVVAALVTVELAVAPFVKSTLQRALDNRFGVQLEVDGVSVAVLSGTATLTGIRVKDGGRTILEAEEARGSIAVRDVLDGRFDFRQLVLVRPVLHIAVEPSGKSDFRRILATPPKTPPRPGPPDVVVLRDLRVEQGRVEWTDPVTDPKAPLHVVIDDIEIALTELQVSGAPVTDSWGDVRVDAVLRQPEFPARLSIVAWAAQRKEEPTFVAHLALTGLDLRTLPQYVSATDRFALGSDVLHMTASFDVRDGAIALGAIVGEVAGTRTVLPLMVGGTTDAPVFDEDSRLATVMRVPLGRVGRIGEVAAGAAWSVLKGGAGGAADIGEGVFGAGKSLAGGAGGAYEGFAAGDPFGALKAAGGGVVGGVKSLGTGLVEGVKSVFGGGSSAAQALAGIAPADLDAQFATLHRERRRRMLEAALASVPKGVEERRARVARELESMPKDEPSANGRPPR
jgi:hypothetical protein